MKILLFTTTMKGTCEILWRTYDGGKNITLIMCVEQPLINKLNNTIFFNELTGNLSKINKNSSIENKTEEVNDGDPSTIDASNRSDEVDDNIFSPSPSLLNNYTPSPTTIGMNSSPSSFLIPSIGPSAESPSAESPSAEFTSNYDNDDILGPSSAQENTTRIEELNKSYENSDNISLIILSISGGIILIFILILILRRYRRKFSVAPCSPVLVNSTLKDKYIKDTNNNKPRDYILEVLPGTPRSALFNRVPVAKNKTDRRRSRSLPRRTNKGLGFSRRVNSLPDLKKVDIENSRKKDKLPPLPFQDNPPPIPARTERIRRLVNIKKKMREQKEKTSKLLAI